MPITHTVVKVPGQRLHAIADWNANHTVTSPLPVGTLTLASGSITDTSGAISFGNENLSTIGTLGCGTITLTNGSDILPAVDDTSNLGSPTKEFRNLYLDRILYSDGINCTGTSFLDLVAMQDNIQMGLNMLLCGIPATFPIRIYSVTGPAYGIIDTANTVRLGAAAVNYIEFNTGGDLVFVGGAGLVFGSCSVYHANWLQVAAQNVWYNVVDADFINGLLHNVTHDGNGKLTVLKAGMYKFDVNLDLEANGANVHIEIGFEKNGSGAAETEGILCNETKFANEEHQEGTTALLDLAVNDTIELCVRTTDAGNPTIKVDCVSMNCVQIGGT